MKKGIVLFVLWFSITIWNIGAINAHFRAEWPELDQSPRHAMADFSNAVLFGLLPPFIILTPFITGFYMDGWTLDHSAIKCTSDHPEIWCK